MMHIAIPEKCFKGIAVVKFIQSNADFSKSTPHHVKLNTNPNLKADWLQQPLLPVSFGPIPGPCPSSFEEGDLPLIRTLDTICITRLP